MDDEMKEIIGRDSDLESELLRMRELLFEAAELYAELGKIPNTPYSNRAWVMGAIKA